RLDNTKATNCRNHFVCDSQGVNGHQGYWIDHQFKVFGVEDFARIFSIRWTTCIAENSACRVFGQMAPPLKNAATHKPGNSADGNAIVAVQILCLLHRLLTFLLLASQLFQQCFDTGLALWQLQRNEPTSLFWIPHFEDFG